MTDPVDLASRHCRERGASGLSKDGQLIAATAATMIVEFTSRLTESTTETCGAEAEAISRLFLRHAAEMLLMGAELPDAAPAEPCAGECGVEAHRHLIAIGPDGTRIYRETP